MLAAHALSEAGKNVIQYLRKIESQGSAKKYHQQHIEMNVFCFTVMDVLIMIQLLRNCS